MKAGWVLFFFAALMVATCFSESLKVICFSLFCCFLILNVFSGKVNVYYPSKEFARPSSTAVFFFGSQL